jgi:UDP-N-acetylglucosamine acyltransferase
MRASETGPVAAAQVEIHPQAIVHPTAELGVGVSVGPWSLIGPSVTVGDRTNIGPNALLEKNTTVGIECQIHKGAVLGTNPQDLKFQGEDTRLEVGDRAVIREYTTLNRGTAASGVTKVGDNCLLMAYAHVAHDCRIGNHVILSNAVNMAGHVEIQDHAIVGGLTAIHQFVRIGAHAFIGGASRISQDVTPYCRVAGSPPKLYGLNTVGLDRCGLPPDTRSALKHVYKIMFLSNLNVSQGLARARQELDPVPEVGHFLDFIARSERGITF